MAGAFRNFLRYKNRKSIPEKVLELICDSFDLRSDFRTSTAESIFELSFRNFHFFIIMLNCEERAPRVNRKTHRGWMVVATVEDDVGQ